MSQPILAPLVALVLWTFVMEIWLYATRIPALSKHRIVYDPRKPAAEFHALLPPEVRWKADNYDHLLQQPTLFYALALTLALLDAGSGLNADLAWIYVGLRVAHSFVQALVNVVLVRFFLFVFASLVLLAMAIRAAQLIF